ncbi:MAG: hybrid sensor histidine kinase/response regulator [Calditrichaeota bacterium]|nr:MAG: hybrid sensor histidine kinase/response regulator [Calditrichota bacterium]MBL1204126.1 hybrid sensor histidine kinase/response regulator [Calditrichota bacterium]NOG43957.1 response regulator [Calditrichota bacterium]
MIIPLQSRINYLFILFFLVVSFGRANNTSLNITSNSKPTLYKPNTVKFEQLSVNDGLSSSDILRIYQDNRGYLWVGTRNGLNKFDGYNFKSFLNEPGDNSSISNSSVFAIFEDKKNRLWIGTKSFGLNQYIYETESFKNFSSFLIDSITVKTGSVYAIGEDKKGNLWIGSKNGLFKVDVDSLGLKKILHYKQEPGKANSLSDNNVRSLYIDSSGIIWIGTKNKGLDRFDPETGLFNNLRLAPDSLKNWNLVNKIIESRNGFLWLATGRGGLCRLKWRSNEDVLLTRFKHNPDDPSSINHNLIRDVLEDKNGVIWVGTANGLCRVIRNGKKTTFKSYISDPNDPSTLSYPLATSLFLDRSGILWVGTSKGLNKYNPGKVKFTHYKSVPDGQQGLKTNMVYAIHEGEPGEYWIGTRGRGLSRVLVSKSGSEDWTHFRTQKDPKKKLSTGTIMSILKDKAGDIWVASFFSGLNKYDRKNDNWIRYRHDPKDSTSLISNRLLTLFEDRSGVLWIGTVDKGLCKFDRVQNKFFQYKNDPTDSLSISHNRVQAILEDSNGRLWIGTYAGGINIFDRENNSFIHFIKDTSNTFSLRSNEIQTLHEDRNKNIWIGTGKGGLSQVSLLDIDKGLFSNYSKKDGLPGNTVYGIIEDDNGKLWLSTNRGLSRFDPQSKVFRNFDLDDGLQNMEFNDFSWFHSKQTGDMFFGGPSGFNVFHPDSIKDNLNLPQVVFTDLKIFNKSADHFDQESPLTKPISESSSITLLYDQIVLTFEFAAIHFAQPNKNKYAYQMEGFEEEWNYVGTRRFATYTNLSPGQYVFKVKGSNSDGIWNETPTTLKITVLPPWWNTWWSYSLYLLFIVGLVFGLRKYELNRQQLKHNFELEHLETEKLKEVNNMKSRFFASISHEFRTPLTLISGPVERLLKQISNKKQISDLNRIQDNATRMNKLVDMYLELSRLESGNITLQKEEQNIIPILKSILASFESIAEAKEIELQFRSSIFSAICMVDTEKFELIIINLISNAIKFTPQNGIVTLCAETSEMQNQLLIKVEDTGVGIPQNQLSNIFKMYYQVENEINKRISGTGIGLTMAKELTQLHGGKIEVESILGVGTTFEITIPVSAVHEISVEEKSGTNRQLTNPNFDEIDRDKKLILIVEDNHQMQDYIKSHLDDEYEIKLAADGKQGFAKAIKTNPALIISDVMMPEMDGYEFCSKIKNDFRTSHVPVILLTAKIEDKDMMEGLATGADNYLKKPFKAAELHVRIKNLIENRSRLHRKFQTDQRMDLKEFKVTSADELFLEKCHNIINENLSKSEFSVQDFANEMALSRIHLYRKLKALTGLNTNKYIQTIRLKKAALLLVSGHGNISQVAYDCGFSNPSYFAEAFKEMFSISPTEYVQKAKNVT